MKKEGRLIWIDLEMSGLDPERHVILEIASIVTDDRLEILSRGPDIAINHESRVLDEMEEWSLTHHQSSGLLDRVRASSYDSHSAERETVEFLSRFCTRGKCPLCGNSVWQDRKFLSKEMPELEAFMHYRNIDVSSIKELARRWYPSLAHFKKSNSHQAMNDIQESIMELRYYREKLFVRNAP